MSSQTRTTFLVMLGVLLGAAVVLHLLLAFLVVQSLTSDPANDPHGYGAIFGFILTACLLPFTVVFAVLLGVVRRVRPR